MPFEASNAGNAAAASPGSSGIHPRFGNRIAAANATRPAYMASSPEITKPDLAIDSSFMCFHSSAPWTDATRLQPKVGKGRKRPLQA
jgi:hypothetical protein